MNVFTKNLVIILFVLLSFNNAYSKAVSKKLIKMKYQATYLEFTLIRIMILKILTNFLEN